MINPRAIDLTPFGYNFIEQVAEDDGEIVFVYSDQGETSERCINITYDTNIDMYFIESLLLADGTTTLTHDGDTFTMELIHEPLPLPVELMKYLLDAIDYACLEEIKVKSKKHILTELKISSPEEYEAILNEYRELKKDYNARNGDYTFCLKKDYSPDFIAGHKMPRETDRLCAVRNLCC